MHILTSDRKQYADDFFHVKNFESLLYDSMNLLYAAHDVDRETDDHDFERSFSRASMLSTLLLFECVANCCIDTMRFGGHFSSDIDKLPFLSKFELFLNGLNKTPFDRGCKIVQAVSELKSLRDKYVHPKVKKLKPVQVQENHYVVEAERTKLLGISHNPSAWRREIALKAAQCANEFFNLYFINWCDFSSNTVCSVLMGTEAGEIPSSTTFGIDMVGGLERASAEFSLDFAYLGDRA